MYYTICQSKTVYISAELGFHDEKQFILNPDSQDLHIVLV